MILSKQRKDDLLSHPARVAPITYDADKFPSSPPKKVNCTYAALPKKSSLSTEARGY
jgi:hypothetical protein